MSLVPTYVRAVDGAWYLDPVVEFEEGFIVFDDDDPPELVMWRATLDAPPASLHTCRAVLDRVLGPRGHQGLMGMNGIGERSASDLAFRPASWWFFILLARIPVPKQHFGRFRKRPRGDCVVYDFEK